MLRNPFGLIALLVGVWTVPVPSGAQDWEALSPRVPSPAEEDGSTSASVEERLDRLEAAWQTTQAESGDPCIERNAGYDKGFFIEQIDRSKSGNSFLLRHSTRFQFRYNAFDSDGPNPDENNLEIERVRPKFAGYMFWPHMEYELQLDIDNDDEDRVELYNAFFRYAFSEPLGWANEMAVKVGLWKMPLFRQEYTSDGRLMLVDRSMANEFFNIDHSVAVGLEGEWKTAPRPTWWHLNVLNGFDTDGRSPGRAGDLDRNFGYLARVYTDLVGEWGKDEEPDLSYHECPAIRVGANGAFTHIDSEGMAEFRTFRVVDSGDRLSDLVPGLEEFAVWLYGVDAGFKYRGLSVLSEFYFRNIFDVDGASLPNLFDHGYYVQVGYFIIPEKLELTSRHSRIVGNSGTLGGNDQSADEVGGGFNYYIKGHNLKIQFDVLSYNGTPVSSSSAQLRPGDDGVLYRALVQWTY